MAQSEENSDCKIFKSYSVLSSFAILNPTRSNTEVKVYLHRKDSFLGYLKYDLPKGLFSLPCCL